MPGCAHLQQGVVGVVPLEAHGARRQVEGDRLLLVQVELGQVVGSRVDGVAGVSTAADGADVHAFAAEVPLELHSGHLEPRRVTRYLRHDGGEAHGLGCVEQQRHQVREPLDLLHRPRTIVAGGRVRRRRTAWATTSCSPDLTTTRSGREAANVGGDGVRV